MISTKKSKAQETADRMALIPWNSDKFCRRCEGLTEDILNCGRGRFHGTKSATVDVMILGEAPGEEEQKAGQFFVGPAGYELSKWLRNSGLDKRKIWLDNAVRCGLVDHMANLPPKDAIRLVKNCRPYLVREIERLKPKVIVPLGNRALQAVTGLTKISNWTGKIIKHRELQCLVIPTYHPAAIIRGNRVAWQKMAISVLREIARISRLKRYEFQALPETIIVETELQFNAMIRQLTKAKRIILDFETIGLNPHIAKIIGLSIAIDDRRGWFVPWMKRVPGVIKGQEKLVWDRTSDFNPQWRILLKRIFEQRSVIKVMHGSSFDQILFQRLGWDLYPIEDTQVVNAIVQSMDNDLKSMAHIYTDFGGYETDLELALSRIPAKDRDYASLNTDLLSRYACYDGVATVLADQEQRKIYSKNLLLKRLLAEQNELRYTLNQMSFTGIALDIDHVRDLRERYVARLKDLQSDLRRMLKRPKLELNSIPQLKEALFGAKGAFPSAHKFGIREISTDSNTLKKIRSKLFQRNPTKAIAMLDSLLEYRKYQKRVSTYLDVFVESPDECSHSTFTQDVVRTGRLSSRDPNLQNQPREKEMRDCFKARSGHTLCELDFKQLEMFIAAELSEDPVMLKLLNSGGDIHSYVGFKSIKKSDGTSYDQKMFETDKEMRAKAKIVGFSIIYGKIAMTLAEDLQCTVDEAGQIIHLLKSEAFKRLGNWILEQEMRVEKDGYVRTIFGRTLPIPNHDSLDKYELAAAHRKAVNYAIQSAASDCVVIGINRIARRLRKGGFGSTKLLLTVHDSLIAEVPDHLVMKFARMATKEMETRIPELKHARLRVDISAGKKWGSLEKLAI